MVARRTFLKYVASLAAPLPSKGSLTDAAASSAGVMEEATTIPAIATGNAELDAFHAYLSTQPVLGTPQHNNPVPQDTGDTLLPLLRAVRPFYDAAKRIETGDEQKNIAIRNTLDGLFEERRQIALQELHTLHVACTRNTALMRDADRANGRRWSTFDTGSFGNDAEDKTRNATILTQDVDNPGRFATMDTSWIRHYLEQHAEAARTWMPVADTDKTLKDSWAKVDAHAFQAEERLGLPKGTLQSTLNLDESRLLRELRSKREQDKPQWCGLGDGLSTQDFFIRVAELVANDVRAFGEHRMPEELQPESQRIINTQYHQAFKKVFPEIQDFPLPYADPPARIEKSGTPQTDASSEVTPEHDTGRKQGPFVPGTASFLARVTNYIRGAATSASQAPDVEGPVSPALQENNTPALPEPVGDYTLNEHTRRATEAVPSHSVGKK